MTDNPIDVYIVGTGMVGYRQITKETENAIEESEKIFLVHYHQTFTDYLDKFDIEVVDLTEEYGEGADRGKTYERMADRVINTAETCDAPVTFALYGHPLVFVSPSRQVIDYAKESDLNVDVRPGISSMDSLYIDLELDPANNGIQMFEATDLLLREYDLNPYVPAMLWQVGTVETSLYAAKGSEPSRFTRLKEYLQEFYPDDHEVVLAQTATYPLTESEQIKFKLEDFEEMSDDINGLQTLYIPQVAEKSIQNEKLRDLIRSEEHLQAITTD